MLLGLGASFAIGGTEQADRHRARRSTGKPRNVIFFLGDGMGTQEITAARYYHTARPGDERRRLPFTGFQTTWSVKPGATAPCKPDYDPDSASTGTKWATGQQDDRRAHLAGPEHGVERPGENYRRCSSAPSGPARPSATSRRRRSPTRRRPYSPRTSPSGLPGPGGHRATCPKETKAAGGLGSIAEQEVDHKVDVAPGRRAQALRRRPSPAARQRQRRSSTRPGARATRTSPRDRPGRDTDARKPVLGLFTPVNMTPSGPARSPRSATARAGEVHRRSTARPASRASPAMTRKAIDLLDQDAQGLLPPGGGRVDRQAGPRGQRVRADRRDRGVRRRDRRRARVPAPPPDTLIVVTADHAHTSQIVGEDTDAGRATRRATRTT